MSDFVVNEVADKNEWEGFLISQNPGTFLQSWNWGETNKFAGYKVKRFGIYENKRLIGIYQMIHQPAKRGPHYLIPGGPVIDFNNTDLLNFTFKSVREFSLKEKVWFVRIRPDVIDSEKLHKTLNSVGLISAPMHLHGEHTLIVDITKGEEELLINMRKTTRYLIKKSLDEGFSIRTSTDPDGSKILFDLQKETVERHGFVGFSRKLFDGQMTTFGKDNQALMFICEKNNKPLVAAIIIFYGEKAFYHHSGSSKDSRGTNASYFTQWQIIKKAKELGLKYYDFWGIAPTDDPKHRFAGVTVFKKGFGGERVDWVHAHDLPVNPLYRITNIFETGRRLRRGL